MTNTDIETVVEEFNKRFVKKTACFPNPNKEHGGMVCPAYTVEGSPHEISRWIAEALLAAEARGREEGRTEMNKALENLRKNLGMGVNEFFGELFPKEGTRDNNV